MANSSPARRYGSAGASVLLAASLSLGALPSVAAANTPNPDNPPVLRSTTTRLRPTPVS